MPHLRQSRTSGALAPESPDRANAQLDATDGHLLPVGEERQSALIQPGGVPGASAGAAPPFGFIQAANPCDGTV
jgi:hypothetical protein